MNTRELVAIGFPAGACAQHAKQVLQQAHAAKRDMAVVTADLKRLAVSPSSYVDHEVYGGLARKVQDHIAARGRFQARDSDAPYRIWGDNLEAEALRQMRNACKLPVAVSGALMPDAHVGYGLPIGGVLATRNAVIPYAVGVDIACRMKMTVLDLPLDSLANEGGRLSGALARETRFGVGGEFKDRRQHDVMDADWNVTKMTSDLKNRAWAQLGTSGSGNHFVEFGQLTVLNSAVGLPEGQYVALLSHSGSRGTGAQIAAHYSKLAMKLHSELPKELAQLAWLDLDLSLIHI